MREEREAQVSETLERMRGVRQSVHSLERINQQLSGSVEAFWAGREPAPAAQDDELVVCSADSKGVVRRRAVTAVDMVAERDVATRGMMRKRGQENGRCLVRPIMALMFAPSRCLRRCLRSPPRRAPNAPAAQAVA